MGSVAVARGLGLSRVAVATALLVFLTVGCRTVRSSTSLPSSAACSSPTSDRPWAPYRDSLVGTASRVLLPNAPPAFENGFAIERLGGVYDLTVVATANATSDTIVRGRLELRPTTLKSESVPSWSRVFPLWGWSDVALDAVGAVSLAHPVSAHDERRPGVQLDLDSATRRVTMTFGGSLELRPDGSMVRRTDSGVLFYVFRATERELIGRWVDGGMSSNPPEGYFCAIRRS